MLLLPLVLSLEALGAQMKGAGPTKGKRNQMEREGPRFSIGKV